MGPADDDFQPAASWKMLADFPIAGIMKKRFW
jgi:hypothetical protein